MYGIVEISGHQYKVAPGTVIDVQKLPEGPDDGEREFDRVYFISGPTPRVGYPTVAGARVKARILREGRSRKICILKRRPGMYQKRGGHRRSYTALLITEIHDGQGQVAKMEQALPAVQEEDSHGP